MQLSKIIISISLFLLFFFAGIAVNTSLEGKASAPIVSGCSQNYCPDDIDSTCPSTWNWLRCDVNENNNTCENRSCYDVEEN